MDTQTNKSHGQGLAFKSRSAQNIKGKRAATVMGALALLSGLCYSLPQSALAIGAGDADTAINSYNSTFLVQSGGLTYFKTSLSDGTKDYFWQQALDIQGVEDAYRRSKSAALKTEIGNLLTTFLAQNAGSGGQQDWTWNQYNDDLAWAGLAFIRGYQVTGTAQFLTQAEYAFNLAYNRGWDTTLGGGIWWDTAHSAKSGLSNNPHVILAAYIYEATGDVTYLNKANAIYNWIWNTLYVPSTGGCDENISSSGVLAHSYNVYNQGAFISAANVLHRLNGADSYYNDAKRTIDYVINNKTSGGILSSSQRNGTYVSEFARGMGEFVRDNNMWSTYYTFMVNNANAAWAHRRTDKNVAWNNWTQMTPSDNTVGANECISAVVMLQVTPSTQPGFTEGSIHRITPKVATGSALDVTGGATTNGTKMEIWGSTGGNNQKYQLVNLGSGWHKLVPQSVTSATLDVPGGSTANGTQLDIWGANGGANQSYLIQDDFNGAYKLIPRCSPRSVINVSGGNTANGTAVIIWQESNGGGADNERWLLQ